MKHLFTILFVLVASAGLTAQLQAQKINPAAFDVLPAVKKATSVSSSLPQRLGANKPARIVATSPSQGARLAATSETFSYTGSIVTYTVPAGVTSLTIEARGAEGGNYSSSQYRPGKGAVITGTIAVTPGQQLKILVGQQPETTFGNGGGGGSFVTKSDDTPLVIAGGGGGSGNSAENPQKDGKVDNNGGSTSTGDAGGTGGNGGSGMGGGGGLLTNGTDGGRAGGKAFVNGGAGGFSVINPIVEGGFGGGGEGSGSVRGGGGGGYSGGGGAGSGVGGGGGSFNAGTLLFTRAGATDGNSGNGLVIITYALPTIRYVKPVATGTGDGTSWANASGDLQSQIDAAGVQQVWVAGGRYTSVNNSSFSLKNGVAVYGGFIGNETSLRPAVSPVTGQPSSTTLTINRGSVIINFNLDNTALLDGVVITGGNTGVGGGIYNESSSPVLTNCVISGNSAGLGGGIYNTDSSPVLTNCVISGNSATRYGGGVYTNGNSSYVLTNCLISGNSASLEGGGIYNFTSGNPRLIGCTLTANTAPSGAAINTNSNTFILTNTILWNNQNQNAIVINGQGVVEANNSLIESGETDYTGTGNLMATSSPFVSATDFQLTACSVAIDAGSNSANTTLTDLAGNARLVRRIDMGAYEFQGTPIPSVAITQQPVSGSSVCVGSTVTATVSVTGTSPAYQWYKDGQALTGQTSATLTLSNVQLASAGSYSAVVTGSCNSVTSTAFSLTVNAVPSPTLINDGPLSCVKTSVRLTTTGGTTGATYLYSPGAQSSSASSTTASVSQAGPYSVTVTNPSGCSSVATTTVNSNTTAPTATLDNNGPITCNQRTVTLTAAGVGTYTFSPGANQVNGGNTATVTNEGPYSVTVTGTNGCTATQSTQVTSNTTAPTATLSNSGTITCTNRSATLNASGGGNYAFSSGATATGPTTATVSNGGLYSVTVTGENGCTATTSTTVESNTTAPNATLSNNGPIADNNQTVTLTAGGGTSYAFSPGATSGGGNTATVTSPGIYSVTATGANGCTGVASTTVTGAQNPATICRNGTAVIRVTTTGAPVKYEWYKNTLNSARLAEITNLQRGTATSSLTLINQQVTANYYVRVTDATGSAVVYGPFKVTVNMGCITALGRLAAEEVDLKITLLDNPLIGEQLRATVSGAAGKALHVQLLDLSGRPLRSQQWQQADANQSLEWNMGGQASGVYLLQATTDEQRHSLKVIK